MSKRLSHVQRHRLAAAPFGTVHYIGRSYPWAGCAVTDTLYHPGQAVSKGGASEAGAQAWRETRPSVGEYADLHREWWETLTTDERRALLDEDEKENGGDE